MKGAIELLTGNPHGLLVLLISTVAGLLMDATLLIVPRRLKSIGIVTGAALAAGSNVVLFQLFVRLPANDIVIIALVGFSAIAALSGAVLGGLLSLMLVKTLLRAGVVTEIQGDRQP